MARNIKTTGSGLIGGDEIVAKLTTLVRSLQGQERSQLARAVLNDVGSTAWDEIGSVAKRTAESKGLPKSISDAIFVDAGLKGIESRQKLSALVGVRKKTSMVEWRASSSSQMNAKAKIGTGGRVAMSLATMFEYGTSIMPPKPYLRPAIESGRSGIPSRLAVKLWSTIKLWNGNNPQ